jgi:serine/threonine protein kinase
MPGDDGKLNLDSASFPVERYEPIRLLGKGALGEVYLAKDKTLRRVVAVKCLITVTDEQVVAFHREAKIASKLSHANIIGSLDFGTTENGRPYLALEYFDGISLEAFLDKRNGISEDLAVDIFVQVARALQYIHEHQIFHRDLKPSNILLKVDGDFISDLRIIDFGLSSIKEEFQTKTLMQGRTLVGTPLYMSPDQVSGGVYDARSEVYSLACLMFEALTGLPPFPGDSSMVILEEHLTKPPPLLSEVRPDLQFSYGMQRILLKCLEKDKDDRFQSMQELVEALEDRISFGETDGSDSRKARSSASVTVGVALCAVAVLGIAALIVVALNDVPIGHPAAKTKIVKEKDLEPSPFQALDKPGYPINFLNAAEQAQGDGGVYFWGEESIPRLKTLSDAGAQRNTITLRGMPLTGKEVDLLAPIKPYLVQMHNCVLKSPDAMSRFAANKSIQMLGFHQCDVTPADLEALKPMAQLDSLILEHCKLNDAHVAAMAKLGQVRKFALDGNDQITIDGIKLLSRKDHPIAVWLNAGPVGDLLQDDVRELKRQYNIILVPKTAEVRDRDEFLK